MLILVHTPGLHKVIEHNNSICRLSRDRCHSKMGSVGQNMNDFISLNQVCGVVGFGNNGRKINYVRLFDVSLILNGIILFY